MDVDIRVIEDLKKQIEKGRNNFRKSPKDRITGPYVSARLESLEELKNKFCEKHEEIISSYPAKELDKSTYMTTQVFDDGYEVYLTYKGELKAALASLGKVKDDDNLPGGSTYSNVKLQKINIPFFSGVYTEWSSFRDLFVSLIHNNSKLDDVQRLHYLKTQVRGEALQLIKHIPITHNNYKKCWETLRKRYDNKRFMSNCILKRLFSQRSLNVECAHGIKELLNTTNDCLQELGNLGVKVEQWDVIIIYIMCLKLDPETRKQWELQIASVGDELPTFALFQDFLENRFQALEIVEPPNRAKPKPIQNSNSNPKVLHATSQIVSCPYCHEDHRLYNCGKFTKEDVQARQEIVKSLGVCFNCLNANHSSKTCRVATRCRICKGSHHTLLHGRASGYTVATTTEVAEEDNEPESPEEANIAAYCSTGKHDQQSLLATALVKVESVNKYPQILRALVDQGSQASFITEAAVQLLRLKKIATKTNISGVGGGLSSLTSKYSVEINIASLYDPSFKLPIKAYVLSAITSMLPDKKFSLPKWKELDAINLADPHYDTPNKIDLLLGTEVYCSILKDGLKKNPLSQTIAQDTYLGWILSGRVGFQETELLCHNVVVSLHLKSEADELLKKFWEIESEPKSDKKVLTREEQACEEHFLASTSRETETGRYVVELPFRPDFESTAPYGNTRAVAVQRLLSLEKRLARKPQQRADYSHVLREYLTLGHMEEIPKNADSETRSVWLPHHAVIRMDKTTTKTRVVFNASDRSANGISLNDTLMVGPTLQPELRHLIMRWRLHPVCLTADIIKMYRQVKVAPKHIDCQRIVWREDVGSEIKDYRLLTVTFGTSCAPYLAVKALQQVAVDEGHKFPLAASKVKTDFYMDDLLTGCQSEKEAGKLYSEMNALLKKAGFILQKWTSNRNIEELQENKSKDREIKEDNVTKILGLTWNRRTDEFDYSVQLSTDIIPDTKRKVIAEICRLYDPLGWLAPCIITAKIFIQKLWLSGLDWDDKLTDDLLNEWESYRNNLTQLIDFHLPRWVQKQDGDLQVELHGFSDASNLAYAAVVYIRCVSKEGKVETHLVSAKTKVAPIKQISIPRLELCGAVLVTKLLTNVAKVMNINKANLHAWTDSTIVLAWLCDHPSRWKTFVANRTSEILSLLDASQWSYVQSKDNPADCASRGLTPTQLLHDKLWKNGPTWLCQAKLPYCKPQSICTKTDLEAKNLKVHTVVENNEFSLWSKFSSLRKLVRVVAYCRRFLQFTGPKLKPPPYLTATELQNSLVCCIKQHQIHAFPEEIGSLLKNKPIYSKSKLSTLNPFLDNAGVLRVGGRIENADLPDNSKHPIIIAGDSPLAKLIVADAHEKTMHGGQQLTCNYIRRKYWVIKCKNMARSYIHNCIPCIRNAARTRTQLMGQLPTCRVTPQKPFLHSGVDYAGPINIRVSKGRGYRSYKGYICLFVCMSTKAVHLEPVSDLTSEGFLSAYRRFVARRGRCNHLWSDNGTNFVGAAKELKRLFASESSLLIKQVTSSLANNGTEWHFIPPHAPNFGGLWEAGIKSAKHHLRRVIGDSTLTYEEMATVLSQIEACLNSRPLSEASPDPDDPAPLTPGHFLVGEPLVLPPDFVCEQLQANNLRRWQLTQRMLLHFWRRWSQEYLTHFFQRYKWKSKITELGIGDVVLVSEDNLPPAKWLYGRVVNIHPGKDKLTRVVTLRYKNSLIQRPTSKLCPLPMAENAVD